MSESGLIRLLGPDTTPDRALLGGKGASLVELIGLGVPVPPGFVITTAASGEYFEAGELPPRLLEELPAAVAAIEERLGRGFGDEREPLLVSVRSGAPVSMPGMMDTILNVGLTGRTLPGMVAAAGGDEAFGQDCFARLRKMYAASVDDSGELPEDPHEQLRRSIVAVFESWNSKRAQLYRRFNKLADTGTAIVIQAMVFGNGDERSGTGVLFTRDPSTGEPHLYGDYLAQAQGEDVVAGSHNTADLEGMRALLPDCHAELTEYAARVEAHFGDLCEIEFTVERGRLWLLQARAGQRSAQAAIVAAVQLAEAGTIDRETAVSRVKPEQLEEITRPTLDRARLDPATVLATAVGASPGIAIGTLAFDSAAAVELAAKGENAILVRAETSPEDLEGIIACTGLLTLRGGKTSHAAVVTRGLGRPCVCGAEELQLDAERGELLAGDTVIQAGETISIDGEGGHVILGEAPITEPSPSPEAATLAEWIRETHPPNLEAFMGQEER
jgi:pyruvate,orthophosphate dikinase